MRKNIREYTTTVDGNITVNYIGTLIMINRHVICLNIIGSCTCRATITHALDSFYTYYFTFCYSYWKMEWWSITFTKMITNVPWIANNLTRLVHFKSITIDKHDLIFSLLFSFDLQSKLRVTCYDFVVQLLK